MKDEHKKTQVTDYIILIAVVIVGFIAISFILSKYSNSTYQNENPQTIQPIQQEQYNPCENVVCNDYCSGNTRYINGYCENGQCKYYSDYCENGCSNGRCNPLPTEDFTAKNEKSIIFIMYNAVVTTSNGDVSLPQYGSGVIYSQDGNKVYVITSRHVVDCWFSGSCRYANVPKRSENITIRTNGGTFYNPTSISFAPHSLDLALLIFESTSSDFLPATIYYTANTGDKVTAIGYPAVVSYPTVLEFSKTHGTITDYKNYLTDDGFSFKVIETDALTSSGSSGGGLFKTNDGSLVGIVTWKDYVSQNTFAIDIKTIQSINYQFIACPSGYFVGGDEKCYPYCPVEYVVGDDLKCHETCGNPITYCKTGSCYYGMCI